IILQKWLGVGTAAVASSVCRGCLAGWVMIQDSAWEMGYWSGGAPVRKKSPSSGRQPIPARRPSRVGSRRDPSDGRVNLVVPFSIPMPRKSAGAFIVSVVDHSYLVALLFLWPTMRSYPSTTLVIHVVRRAFAGRGVDPTCVRSAVRPLTPPILASGQLPVSRRPRRRASCLKNYLENIKVLKQGVKRGEEAITSPEDLNYPKTKYRLECGWTQRSVMVS
ncbi:hypothetical protein B296_00043569, partial [Ensete ventricosum]